MTPLLTGFMLGLAGSGHCAGMCGPLVLTFGRSLARARRVQMQDALLYHAGRLLTYVALALPLGFIGQALVLRGFGRALAVVAAGLLLASAASAMKSGWSGPIERVAATVASRACATAHRWRLLHPVAGPAIAGAAHGLIPCGLVYAAAAASAAMGSTGHAALSMIGFGLGTLPILIALSISAAAVPVGWRMRLRQLTPVVLALTAVLLLIRGFTQPSSAGHHQHTSMAMGVLK